MEQFLRGFIVGVLIIFVSVIVLPLGLYEITDDQEFDPFSEQARRVAD